MNKPKTIYRSLAIACLLAGSAYAAPSIFDPNAPSTPVATPKTLPANAPATPKTLPVDEPPVAVPSKPLPPKAQAAKVKFDGAVAKAKADYDKAVKAAAGTYGIVLEQSIREATHAGDLDAALAVKAEKTSLDLPPMAVGDNLLTNNWQTVMWWSDKKTVTHGALEGRKAVIFNYPKRNEGSLQQTVTLRPNTNYQLTGLVKTQNLIDGERRDGEERGAFLLIGNPNITNLTDVEHSEMALGTTDWKLLTINFNSGQRTNANIVARVGTSWHTDVGVAAFADLKLVETK